MKDFFGLSEKTQNSSEIPKKNPQKSATGTPVELVGAKLNENFIFKGKNLRLPHKHNFFCYLFD